MKKFLLILIAVTGLGGLFTSSLSAQVPAPVVKKCFPLRLGIVQSPRQICPIEVCIEQELACDPERPLCVPPLVNPRNCVEINPETTGEVCYWDFDQESGYECSGACHFNLVQITFRHLVSLESITITGQNAITFINLLNGTIANGALRLGTFRKDCQGNFTGTQDYRDLWILRPTGGPAAIQVM